ncbi:hypothetical protein SUGI_0285970 [Cryptomeria japonica]|nr:hypothetical protein SUGI_0285970 [Cryptomeria japonica]
MAPPKSTSEAWKHVTQNGTHIKCNLCEGTIIGTLTRLREHFLAHARGLGGGVQACIGATPELKAILEKELVALMVGKMKAQKKQRIEGDISRFTSIMSSSSVQSKPVSVSKQNGTLNNFWKPVEKRQVDDAVADFFYTSAIPFNVARNPHFRNAVQKIAKFGKGYTPPGSEAIRTTLLQSNFWESAAKVLLVCETIVDVFRMVDGDTPCLGMLYESMDRCKESIQKALNNEEAEYMQIWATVDRRWKMMHTPLHAVACFLEPKLFAIDKRGDNEIMAGLYQAISRYVPNLEIAALIRDQSWQYKRGEGMFGGAEAKYDSPYDELSSDTDDDDLASQPSALDDLELF